MMDRRDPPRSTRALKDRIRNLARADAGSTDLNVRTNRRELAIATVVVGQLLPGGVIKGGTALQVRLGVTGARFTRDLDAARSRGTSLDDFVDQLDEQLERGWDGFTGQLLEEDGPTPPDVPDHYIMRPFTIRLLYRASWWRNVILELGHDEIDSTAEPELVASREAADVFARLGLPEPAPLRVLSLDHQVAQKLHACTSQPSSGTNQRARDLVDLQLVADQIELAAVAVTARRLFAARKGQRGRRRSRCSRTGRACTRGQPRGSGSWRRLMRLWHGPTTSSIASSRQADRPSPQLPAAWHVTSPCRAGDRLGNGA